MKSAVYSHFNPNMLDMKKLSLLMLLIGLTVSAVSVVAQQVAFVGFEQPDYQIGAIDGQQGWSVKQPTAFTDRNMVMTGGEDGRPQAPQGVQYLRMRSHHNTTSSAMQTITTDKLTEPFRLSVDLAFSNTDVVNRTWTRYITIADSAIGDSTGVVFGFQGGNGDNLVVYRVGNDLIPIQSLAGPGNLTVSENEFYQFVADVHFLENGRSYYDLSVYNQDGVLLAYAEDLGTRHNVAYQYDLFHAQITRVETGTSTEFGDFYVDNLIVSLVPEASTAVVWAGLSLLAFMAIRRRIMVSQSRMS